MASTIFSTSDNARLRVYSESLYRQALKEQFFNRFTSADGSNLVHSKRDLAGKLGTKVTFGYINQLDENKVILGSSGDSLEGNEEGITWYTQDVELEQYRFAVKNAGKLADKHAMFSITGEAQTLLKNKASRYIDKLLFDAIQTSPTAVIYAGAATTTATLTATTKLDLETIDRATAIAMTGNSRAFDPLKPVVVEGKAYLVLVTHPYAIYDLRRNAEFQQAMREAMERGKTNPLFSGATAVWNNTIVFAHERINKYTTGGAGGVTPYCTGTIMGAQALMLAEGESEEIVQETFDYKDKVGYAWGVITKATKPKFNSKDLGSMGVYTTLTNLAAGT